MFGFGGGKPPMQRMGGMQQSMQRAPSTPFQGAPPQQSGGLGPSMAAMGSMMGGMQKPQLPPPPQMGMPMSKPSMGMPMNQPIPQQPPNMMPQGPPPDMKMGGVGPSPQLMDLMERMRPGSSHGYRQMT